MIYDKISYPLYKEDFMTIHIRQATLSDLHAIVQIEAICFPPAEAASREHFEERLKAFKGSFFVAEKEGEVIGFINGSIVNEKVISDAMFEDVTFHNPNGIYQSIFGLDVLPNHQHQGIATKLMNHMITSAKAAGRKGLVLTCKEALIPFYSQFGYVNQGISLSVHGGATWYDMILLF